MLLTRKLIPSSQSLRDSRPLLVARELMRGLSLVTGFRPWQTAGEAISHFEGNALDRHLRQRSCPGIRWGAKGTGDLCEVPARYLCPNVMNQVLRDLGAPLVSRARSGPIILGEQLACQRVTQSPNKTNAAPIQPTITGRYSGLSITPQLAHRKSQCLF